MSNTKKQEYLQESEKGFTHRTAIEEAARCLLCHDAPCSKDCPAGTDPGKFIRSIRFRNIKGAAETIRENNIMGGSCARVCPYDRLCEEACSKTDIDRPIEIGKLQRYALEVEKDFDMKILQQGKANGKKIALIGAGPASIACATELVKEGFETVIYEKEAKAGGVLTYGIPPARLPQDVVDQDIKAATDIGVKIEFGQEVGKDISLEELKDKFDAVFIGVGLSDVKIPEIPGTDLDGVYGAADFLKEAREKGGSSIATGKRVVVIGGGDVAMDCAATAKLSGAKEVGIWYRRTIDEAPANISEVLYVTNLGIPITNNMAPKKVVGNGKVEAIEFTGRDGSSEAKKDTDIVVFAIGQKPLNIEKIGKIDFAEDGGCISNDPKVFAGGDIVNGGKTIVEAVQAGKLAAENIAKSV